MASFVAISGLYLVSAFLSARYILPVDGGPKPRGFFILKIVIYLLWPIWLPFAALFKLRAQRAKPSYRKALAEYVLLTQKERALSHALDVLVEQLSIETNEHRAGEFAHELARLIRERAALQASALLETERRARAIYARHLSTFSGDKSLIPMPQRSPNEERLFQFRENDGLSRLRLSVELDDGRLSAFSATSIPRSLERHLNEEAVLAHAMVKYQRDRYSRGSAAQEQIEWTLIFSSAFKKSVKHVGTALQRKANEAITQILVDPMTPRGDTVTRLSHDKMGLWRYRVGDYRLIYMPMPKERQLYILRLAHRNEAYH